MRSGLLTFLGLEFHLIEQRIVQLQLAIGGQCMLRRHQHIWTTQGLWIQIGGLHGGNLAIVIATLPWRITSIRAKCNVINGTHGFAIILIDLRRRGMG